MHPVLSHRSRILGYLASWAPIALLIAVLLRMVEGLTWPLAAVLGIPIGLVYAFICLAAWYPSRAASLSHVHVWRSIASHAAAAVLSSGVWQLSATAWAYLVGRLPGFEDASRELSRSVPLLFFVGLLIYTLAAAASYLLIAFERSREAEQEAFEATKRQELASQELSLARRLQQRLLPAETYSDETVEIAARTIPAYYVGGDFYDYFRLADGTWRLAIGDVAGKGTAASLVMATVKAMLPLLAAERSITETFDALNTKLAGELEAREFVALALLRLDPSRGEIELVNAGIPDPFILLPGSEPFALEAPQPRMPLGIRPGQEYRSISYTLPAAARLLLYSDGVPESCDLNGDPLGYDRLRELTSFWTENPSEWIDGLTERLEAVPVAEATDDWTVLLLGRRRDSAATE